MNFVKNYRFKEATIKESNIIFKWSNDPVVRKNSRTKNKISFLEHQKWYESKLKKNDSFFWLYCYKIKPCGLVRIEKKNNFYFLSYLIDFKYRRKKLSKPMLKEAINKFILNKNRVKYIYADVLSDNKLSSNILKSIGFKFNKLNQRNKIINLILEIN